MFAALTEQVLTHGPLLALDRWVRDHVQHLAASHPVPGADSVAEYWSDLGNSAIALPVLVACAAIASARLRRRGRGRELGRWWSPLVTAATEVALLSATVLPAKSAIGRPGPAGNAAGDAGLGYFPSGHTATATVCLGLGAWLLARTAHSRRSAVASGVVAAVACAGVAGGLIWRNYHWLTDVCGAWALSGLLLWGLTRWFRLGGRRRSRH